MAAVGWGGVGGGLYSQRSELDGGDTHKQREGGREEPMGCLQVVWVVKVAEIYLIRVSVVGEQHRHV